MPPSVSLTVPITDTVDTPLINSGLLSSAEYDLCSVASSPSVFDTVNLSSIVIEQTAFPSTFDMRQGPGAAEKREQRKEREECGGRV